MVITFGHKDLRKLFINIINIIGGVSMENRGLLTYYLSLQIRLSEINLLSKNHFTFDRRIDNPQSICFVRRIEIWVSDILDK